MELEKQQNRVERQQAVLASKREQEDHAIVTTDASDEDRKWEMSSFDALRVNYLDSHLTSVRTKCLV